MDGAPVQRRLLILVSIAFALDWAFYSALTPLLPHLQRELGMTDGAAGVLVGTYAIGILLAALAAGWVSAWSGVRTALLASLVVFAAVTVLFGFTTSVVGLDLARGLQGVAAAVTWAAGLSWLLASAARDRHGVLIGTATSASVAGALVGPALGALAVQLGRPLVFSTVGALALGLALVLRTLPAPARAGDIRVSAAFGALRGGAGAIAAWTILLAGVITGAMVVLAPLRLNGLQVGAAAIAAIFLLVAAIEIIAGPVVGRFTDRRGPRRAMCVALVLTTVPLAGLAIAGSVVPTVLCIVLVLPCALAALTPAYLVLGALASARGVAIAAILGVGNLAWAAGESAGALSAGWLAGSNGAALYVALAALGLATTLALSLTRQPALAPASIGRAE